MRLNLRAVGMRAGMSEQELRDFGGGIECVVAGEEGGIGGFVRLTDAKHRVRSTRGGVGGLKFPREDPASAERTQCAFYAQTRRVVRVASVLPKREALPRAS